MVFCSHFHSDFYCFFDFLDRIFFLNSFSNPFTAHSGPSFLLESKLHISLVVFVLPSSILALIFCFFFVFLLIFLRNRFPNSLIVRSRSSSLLSQWKFFELYVRTCPAIFFTSSNKKNVSLYLILPPFQHFAWNLFDFSRLVSLFSHSAKSDFEHQLLSKAIQNKQSQCKKLKSEMEAG